MATQSSELGDSATCSQERDVQDSSALIEWLYKHHENPYLTNVEKAFLAIKAKMTVPQVDKLLADAIPRLKKMTVSSNKAANTEVLEPRCLAQLPDCRITPSIIRVYRLPDLY